MSTHAGPNIVENGLVLSLDAANSKSFRGEPTTNLLLNPKPTSTSQYTAVGGTGSVTYDSSTSSVVWQRSTYEAWGSFFHNNAVFNGTLDTAKQYTASFEWKETGTISHSSTWFEIVEYGDTNPAVKVNMLANSTYLYDGFYRFSYTFTPANTGITANFRVWNPATSGTMNFYWRNLQLEQKGYRTPFVDGTRGTTVATGGGWLDLSQNAISCETNASTTYSSSALGSLNFDGASSLIIAPENSALNTQTPSVSVWIKTNNTSQNGFWFEKGNVNTQYALFQEGASIRWRQKLVAGLTNLSIATTSTYISTSQWANVCGTYNSITGDRKIYINGILRSSDSIVGTIETNANGISIGAYGGYNGGRAYWYNGAIGNVQVYNVELTSSQVLQNFNAQRGRYGI